MGYLDCWIVDEKLKTNQEASSPLFQNCLESTDVHLFQRLKMFLVGLTGGVGTGKSTTASMFRELGVPIVDCDLIAKRIVEPGRPAWQKIKVCHNASNFSLLPEI